MTQTPASGPFGPVTTPPMSSVSMATSAAGCCAYDGVNSRDEQRAASDATPAATVSTRVLVMGALLGWTSESYTSRSCLDTVRNTTIIAPSLSATPEAAARPRDSPELLSIIVPVYNEVRTFVPATTASLNSQ